MLPLSRVSDKADNDTKIHLVKPVGHRWIEKNSVDRLAALLGGKVRGGSIESHRKYRVELSNLASIASANPWYLRWFVPCFFRLWSLMSPVSAWSFLFELPQSGFLQTQETKTQISPLSLFYLSLSLSFRRIVHWLTVVQEFDDALNDWTWMCNDHITDTLVTVHQEMIQQKN